MRRVADALHFRQLADPLPFEESAALLQVGRDEIDRAVDDQGPEAAAPIDFDAIEVEKKGKKEPTEGAEDEAPEAAAKESKEKKDK